MFENEPDPSPEVLKLPNVIVQPHHGSATIETRTAIGQLMIDNISAHFAGKPLLTPVLAPASWNWTTARRSPVDQRGPGCRRGIAAWPAYRHRRRKLVRFEIVARYHGEPQIVIEGVSHLYRPPRGRPVLALEDVSLEVREREFLALLGPSGCGKSTLLYLIGGFLPVESGRIAVDGKPVAGARARPRHRVPAFRAVSVEDGARQHPLRPRAPGPAARRAREAARNPSSTSSASPASRTAIPRSFRAA